MTQGLIMMERSMKGAQVAYTNVETVSTAARSGLNKTEQLIIDATRQQAQGTSSFKDIIERKAAENNIMFLPVVNKSVEGKQVYRFGNLNIYLEGSVIYMLQNGSWIPTSIAEVISKSI